MPNYHSLRIDYLNKSRESLASKTPRLSRAKGTTRKTIDGELLWRRSAANVYLIAVVLQSRICKFLIARSTVPTIVYTTIRSLRKKSRFEDLRYLKSHPKHLHGRLGTCCLERTEVSDNGAALREERVSLSSPETATINLKWILHRVYYDSIDAGNGKQCTRQRKGQYLSADLHMQKLETDLQSLRRYIDTLDKDYWHALADPEEFNQMQPMYQPELPVTTALAQTFMRHGSRRRAQWCCGGISMGLGIRMLREKRLTGNPR